MINVVIYKKITFSDLTFVNKKIHEVMEEINPIIFNLIKNITPGNKARISEVTKIIEKNIIEDCKEDVKKLINAKIDESLSIPRNVLLHKDRVQTIQITDEEFQAFEDEVFEMKKIMFEVTFKFYEILLLISGF